MEGKQIREVLVQAVVIKNVGYCPFCRNKTRRSPYGKHQDIEGFDDYCSCNGAFENDNLEREAEELNQSLTRLRHIQAQIPNFRDELMVLQEEENTEEFRHQLAQAAPPFSFADDSQQSTSQPE